MPSKGCVCGRFIHDSLLPYCDRCTKPRLERLWGNYCKEARITRADWHREEGFEPKPAA